MTDHYATLGVQRGASAEEIKSAYRKMAAKHHPDREGGDKAAFQHIQQAYETLSDPNRRASYDQPQPQGFHFDFGRGGDGGGFDFNNIFNMFGQQFHGGQPRPGGHRQQHTRMSLWVTLQDVAEGGRRPVTVGTQHGSMTVEIEIPLGINDGDHVQYGGIGPGGTDLIINFRIHPNPKWHRNGLNLTVEHHVSIWDCLVGNDIEFRDILNSNINLTIPPMTQPNSMLRLRGRGLRARSGEVGDLLVKIVARLPTSIDPELIEQIKLAQKK